MPQGTRADRLLLECRPGLAQRCWTRLVQACWSMPMSLAGEFEREAAGATSCLLGLDMAAEGLEYRVYLGFGAQGHPDDAPLAMRGFKWTTAGPTPVSRVSDYWRVPGAVASMIGIPPVGESTGLDVLRGIAGRALACGLRPDQIDYWACTEHGTGRRSACLRLYETGLTVADLDPEHGPWFDHGWRDAGRRDGLAALLGRPLGWVAAGLDSGARPFLALHREAARDDVLPLISAGVSREFPKEASLA
jgi:hypothetical protein